MKILFLTALISLTAAYALADDAAYSQQYIQDKQAHAAFLREQANDRINALRDTKDSRKPSVISTGASLESLQPAAGPTPVTPEPSPQAADSKAKMINTNNVSKNIVPQ